MWGYWTQNKHATDFAVGYICNYATRAEKTFIWFDFLDISIPHFLLSCSASIITLCTLFHPFFSFVSSLSHLLAIWTCSQSTGTNVSWILTMTFVRVFSWKISVPCWQPSSTQSNHFKVVLSQSDSYSDGQYRCSAVQGPGARCRGEELAVSQPSSRLEAFLRSAATAYHLQTVESHIELGRWTTRQSSLSSVPQKADVDYSSE